MERVAIVGMSLAGLRAAETLRRLGYEREIVAVSAEEHLPYDRPPLSKEFLTAGRAFEDMALRRDGVDELNLEWRLRTRATSLDLAARVVALDDGGSVGYDNLIIATGATPRALPASVCDPSLGGVHSLRTIEDARAIRDGIENEDRICVIGAGFIGAEVAAACRTRGAGVTLLEAQAQPMIRGLGATLGAVCAQLHRDHGVDLRLGVQIDRVEPSTNVAGAPRVGSVVLADGTRIECDLLVVGIGVAPETRWLEDSGLAIDNGVVCDSTCTAAPNVLAAGDIARWPNPLFDDEMMRLEHWTNATEQGAHVAECLVSGAATPFAPVPFVWSDQYDCKIQSVGRFNADDDMEIVRGDLESRKFVALFGRDGRLTGALGFSQPRHVMIARRMIAERVSFVDAIAASNG